MYSYQTAGHQYRNPVAKRSCLGQMPTNKHIERGAQPKRSRGSREADTPQSDPCTSRVQLTNDPARLLPSPHFFSHLAKNIAGKTRGCQLTTAVQPHRLEAPPGGRGGGARDT